MENLIEGNGNDQKYFKSTEGGQVSDQNTPANRFIICLQELSRKCCISTTFMLTTENSDYPEKIYVHEMQCIDLRKL